MQAIDNAKQQLVEGFEAWYEDNFDVGGNNQTQESTLKSKTGTGSSRMIRDNGSDEEE